MIEIIHCKTKADIEKLKNNSALTFEGLNTSNENLDALFNWIKHYTPLKKERVYITSGNLMNTSYDLKGKRKYKDDLHIVSVMLSDIKYPMKLVIPRIKAGGRWMDDIIDNNKNDFYGYC